MKIICGGVKFRHCPRSCTSPCEERCSSSVVGSAQLPWCAVVSLDGITPATGGYPVLLVCDSWPDSAVDILVPSIGHSREAGLETPTGRGKGFRSHSRIKAWGAGT